MHALVLSLLALGSAAVPVPAQPPTYSNGSGTGSSQFSTIVHFGDSYSDNGTGARRITNGTWPADPAYYQGRFTNGPVWVEDVAQAKGWTLHDYAIGGATSSNALVQGSTGKGGSVPVPAMDEQVDSFIASPPADASYSTTIFSFLIGANDVFFNPNLTSVETAASLSNAINKLASKGAKNFLLLNYPDLGLIPYDSYIDNKNKKQLKTYSHSLVKELNSLQQGAQDGLGVKIYRVNPLPLFNRFYFYGDPQTFNFTTDAAYGSCLTGVYAETATRTLCDNPDDRVWWDEFHPTRRSHQLIADAVLKVLNKST